jgi:Ca2+-transporting ATPase
MSQVSTIMGLAIPEQRANNGWIEGAAIWVAVFVVVGVGAGNDWQKVVQNF